MSTKWVSDFNLTPVVYECFKVAESQFKEMIEAYLLENEVKGVNVDFYDDEATHQVGVLIGRAEALELDDQLDELLGSGYWDNYFSLTHVLGQALFGNSFEVAHYIPSTLSCEDPMIEVYCLSSRN